MSEPDQGPEDLPSDVAEPPDDAGPAEAEARKLRGLDSGHPAKGLLVAVAERLARDVDRTEQVRDRIVAVRELLQVVEALDAAALVPRDVPGGGVPDDGQATDPEGGPDDDPFDIGDMPPGVGDPPPT